MGAIPNDATFNLINGTHLFLMNSYFDTHNYIYDLSISRSALLLIFAARARIGILRLPGLV